MYYLKTMHDLSGHVTKDAKKESVVKKLQTM